MELPDGYRALALKNAIDSNENVINIDCNDICEAISVAFIWAETIEGHDFWSKVYDHYFPRPGLPPLP
jgi:hypothetical protein